MNILSRLRLGRVSRHVACAAALLAGLSLLGAASPASAQAGGTANAQYRLATGDVIRVTVFQNPDLTLEARVSETGVISYPLLGSVSIGNLTLLQAEKKIADGLKDGNFVKQPQVSILVTQVRGHQVSVLGQVGRPGRFPLELADTKLTDILATAGGIAAGGADTVVLVGRRNGQPYRVEIDLPGIFGPGRRGEDVVLQNGDVIWVERAPMVYMYGEIARPGPLRLERGMSLVQALAGAGGITQRGTARGLKVHRRDANGNVQILDVQMNDPLRADDVVYVRESVF
jgi:polysaccharide export outer membrane protein